MDLVRNRDCGACTACCRDLAIDDPALRKPAAVQCAHCVAGRGCTIYQARPGTCRDWHCGWRMLPWMAAGMRPDLSGLLVLVAEDPVPGGPPRPGLVFNVLPSAAGPAAEILSRPSSLDVVGALVREDVPVSLGVKDAAGRHGVRVSLNRALGPVSRGRDGDALRTALLRIYRDACGVVRRMEMRGLGPPGTGPDTTGSPEATRA